MLRKRKFNLENGSVSVYAIATVFCFLFILGGIFTSSSSIRKNQLKTLLKIKEIYAQQLDQADEIADSLRKYAQEGLILHYDGINNTGSGHGTAVATWTDLSGNGNDGELKNFNNTTDSGWAEDSIKLDGLDDGIYLGDKLIDLYKSDATIELVIKFTADDSRDIILGNYNKANSINWERGSSAGDQYSLYGRFWYNDGNFNTVTSSSIYTNNKMTIGLIFNKSDNTVSFLTNGSIVETVTSDILANNYDFSEVWLGKDNRTTAGSTPLNGNIYAVRVYNKVLSNDELKQNYAKDKSMYGL